MKIRALHPKKNFLKFLSLTILVLAASVGVVLATQKDNLLLNSQASECDSKNKPKKCEGKYILKTCRNGKWDEGINCRSLGTGKYCSDYGSSAECTKYVPEKTKPTPKSTPKPTTPPCSQSCVARIECTENVGTVIPGTCSGGRVCCDF